MKTLIAALCMVSSVALMAQTYTAKSPNGRNEIRLTCEKDAARYSVWRDGREVLSPAPIALKVRDHACAWSVVGERAFVREGTLATPTYHKAAISLAANGRRIDCAGGWGVELIARDDGVAYRFFTGFAEKEVFVTGETAEVRFSALKPSLWAGYPGAGKEHGKPGWICNWEPVYTNLTLDAAVAKTDAFAALPLVAEYADGTCLVITESDQRDYPGWLLRGSGSERTFIGEFAPEPIEEKCSGPYHHNGMTRYDYLARTTGARTYPWRLFMFADDAAKLCENDAVFALAEPCKLNDVSWIKPGLAQWEWWHNWNLTGVDFKAGKNTATYLHYIDFAAEHHVPYLIMDGGWSKDYKLTNAVPELDLKAVCDHATKKGVGIILWSPWAAFLEDPELYCRTYASYGIKGYKLDGICRNDRFLTHYLEETARIAAKYHQVIDYHGVSKPSGLSRTYPNVLTFEGVHGLENTKWEGDWMPKCDFPKNDLTDYFCRMPAGAMDYTPGAMRNFAKKEYHYSMTEPGSDGTRVHQIALFVMYFSPLQMLCDSPSLYRQEAECFRFMSRVPTVWDETCGLSGRLAEYAAVARRKGDVWYAAAITDWSARTLTIDTAFLGTGTWQVEIFADGINADRNATDYRRSTRTVKAGEKLTAHLQPGGGWAARFTR